MGRIWEELREGNHDQSIMYEKMYFKKVLITELLRVCDWEALPVDKLRKAHKASLNFSSLCLKATIENKYSYVYFSY